MSTGTVSLNSPNMEDFTLRRRITVVYSSKLQPDPISPPQFDINLQFSFQTCNSYWIIRQNSGREHIHIHNVKKSPITNKNISLNNQQFSNYSEACGILFRLFQDWPFSESSRRILVDHIWRRTGFCGENTCANLHFRLIIHNVYVLNEPGFACNMVPASQSSIDSLEMKIIVDGGNCAICMDNIDEGFFMPCLHVFHGDCIKKWLAISHNCPLCRFKMPTADDNGNQVLRTCS